MVSWWQNLLRIFLMTEYLRCHLSVRLSEGEEREEGF